MKLEKLLFVILVTAAVAVASCDDSDGSDEFAADRSACVDRINDFRATIDLPPLQRWRGGESCADDEAMQDSISGAAHESFGQCDEWAQNECPGWGSPEEIVEGCLQAMWNEGPGPWDEGHGHYINMTNESYSEVACGFAPADDDSYWSVQNFR